MTALPDATRLARDGIYVSLGFGVLGFQKLQVRRRAAERSLRLRRDALGADGPLGTVEAGVDVAVDHLVAVLPTPVDGALDGTRRQVQRLLGATPRG
jgi:hypothetical protein